MEEVGCAHGIERVGLQPLGRAPGLGGLGLVPRPVEREPEVEGDERAARVLRGELLQPAQGPARPGGDRGADLSLQRAVAGEDRPGAPGLPVPVVEGFRIPERPRLRVRAQAEVERERR